MHISNNLNCSPHVMYFVRSSLAISELGTVNKALGGDLVVCVQFYENCGH